MRWGGGRLANKIAVITGGAHGIGRASAILFAREGARVAIVDYDAEGGAETEQLVREAGGEAVFLRADIGRREDAERAIAATIDRYGGVDVLFNNAGIMPEGTALTHTEADWDRVMDVNLKAIFLLSRAAIPSMIARGGGSIVNTASVQGLRGHQNRLAYATSKHGVIGITRSLAADFARDGVRVNAICPGAIDTPMLHRVLADLPDRAAALAEFAALHPLGTIGHPDDVAYAALYLASDESRFVTGIALPVDGGYTSLITHV
ncbi:MAG: SDR family NAD(P)-dependent oxidoreductase [Thermomicrobiales bacterium]